MEPLQNKLTQQQLKEFLIYDKHTGIFTWKIYRSSLAKLGEEAGNISSDNGYRFISLTIDNICLSHRAHRLAWLHEHGVYPIDQIDHINHNKLDNRISNLRQVNQTGNSRNMKINQKNTSGFTGIYWSSDRNKWQAQICVSKKVIPLGRFENKDDAIMARLHANKLYGFHANHGKC